jgi:hypothetical protein
MLTTEQQATYFAKLRAQYRALTAEQKALITEDVYVARAFANNPNDESEAGEAAGLETLEEAKELPTVASFIQSSTPQLFAVQLKPETVDALETYFEAKSFSYDDLLNEWLKWRKAMDAVPGV